MRSRLVPLGLVWGLVWTMTAGPALANPAAPSDAGDQPPGGGKGLVVFSKVLADARSFPAVLGTGVGVGLGLPLTAIGYPEATQPVSENVVPALGGAAGQVDPLYQPGISAAEGPVAALGPTANPTARPLLSAIGRKVLEQAPALGAQSTLDHFGLVDASPTKDQPSAEEDHLNFTTKIRAVPLRFLVQLPTEVEVAIPETVVGTGNGYGAAVGQVNPGFLPSALMWSALGFWGGTLAPHPGYVQANFPTGPSQDDKAVLTEAQADGVATWGSFRSKVDAKGNDTASVEGGRLTIPGVLSVGSTEAASRAANTGDRISGQAVSALKDVTIGEVLSIDTVKTVATAGGDGTPEGRRTNHTVSLAGVRVAGVPVVLTGEGVGVAGADALPASQRAAMQQQVNAALKSSGLELQAASIQPADSTSQSGATAGVSVAALRIRFVRPDRPQVFEIDLGYAETSVFTGRIPNYAASPSDGESSPLDSGSEPTVLTAGSSGEARESSGPVNPGLFGDARSARSVEAPTLSDGGLASGGQNGSEAAFEGTPRASVGRGVSAREATTMLSRSLGTKAAHRLTSVYGGMGLMAMLGFLGAPLVLRRVLSPRPEN